MSGVKKNDALCFYALLAVRGWHSGPTAEPPDFSLLPRQRDRSILCSEIQINS